MNTCQRGTEKRRTLQELRLEEQHYLKEVSSSVPAKTTMDTEKRIRREIANSNERRRMQSINTGFQSLRSLLPHHEGEKLSKAAILQQTGEYIHSLEKDKNQLLLQNAQLRQKLKEICPQELDGISPPPKRKKRDTESSDEGIVMSFDDATTDLLELRKQLERERQQRMFLEQRMRNLEAQMEGDKLKPVASRTKSEVLHSHIKSQISKVDTSVECGKREVKDESKATPHKTSPIDMPARTSVPDAPVFTSPQSKRNLEMIAEAIRHLEGESMFQDRHIPNSEDSQTESSTSDQEDIKSESSGQESPLSRSPDDNSGLTRATATLCVTANPLMVPMASMHMLNPHLFRPDVVLHNSS